MPGAGDSTFRVMVVRISPSPSIGSPERVDHSPDECGAHRDLQHAARPAHVVAFPEHEVIAEDHRANVVFLEIERQGGHDLAGFGGRDLQHLAGHRFFESVDSRNAVTHFEDSADFLDLQLRQVRGLDLAEQDILYFAGSERCVSGHGQSGESKGPEEVHQEPVCVGL